MANTFPWQHGVFKLYQGGYEVLVLNCHGKFLNMIFEIRLTFLRLHRIVHQFGRLFKIDHRVNKLLSGELFNNISKLHSNITMKWPAGY